MGGFGRRRIEKVLASDTLFNIFLAAYKRALAKCAEARSTGSGGSCG